MTDKKEFGSYIKIKRLEKNYSQKDLADMLYVSEGAVSKWERGVSYPDITLISDICRILDISEHEFITASNDIEARKIKSEAKKWSTLVTAWDLFFYIAYGVALLTCFIVNLCVNKTLDWFFIVLASLVLAATFTTTPKFIKKYKLLLNVATEFAALWLLLFVCVLYTGGDWFWVTSFSIFVGLCTIFIPIFISVYNLPVFIKRNNAIVSVLVDFILLTILMMIICGYTDSNNWVFSIYFPIALFVILMPLTLIGIIKYTRINKFLKTGLSVLSSLVITCGTPYFVWYVLQRNNIDGEVNFTFPPNFTDWSNAEMISTNTVSIVILIALLVASIFIILGLTKIMRLKK